MIGMTLGERYELLEKIGEGGMSEVYKARCNKLNRLVAVKILRKDMASNEEISEKFKREATAIANLSDANIVNVLDVGTQDKISYIVMEYVKGKTLKEVIGFSGKLGYNSTIKIALQIAKALDCAHKNNIIHRDIKPQNILVMESGEVKVMDFGIAKSIDSNTITNTTSIIGSAHYLSPEQARGTYIDSRADIYSFGVVLYEMVTGKLPFDGDSPVTVALKHLQDAPVPPKNINSSVPESLNKLIIKAMEKEPVKRYQSAKEIILDLQRIQQDPDVKLIDDISEDDGKTIVMAAIPPSRTPQGNRNDYYEDKEDEDEYYEDEDEDDEDIRKPKKKKSYKKLALAVFGVFAVIGILFTIAFMIGMKGDKQIQVPVVIGSSYNDATKALTDLGFVVEKVTEESEKPVDEVLNSNPAAGTFLDKGSKITLTVASKVTTTKMPQLRGLKIDDATKALRDVGLNWSLNQVFDDNVEAGIVIDTDVKANEKVSLDKVITIKVSKGKEVKNTLVPDLTNKTEAEAKALVENAKLKFDPQYKETSDKAQVGKVISQTVAAGTNIAEGQTITVYIGKAKPEIDISTLIQQGMALDKAQQVLDQNGFTVKITGAENGKYADYVVDSFTPTKGQKGDTITIVAKKKPVVTGGSNEAVVTDGTAVTEETNKPQQR